MSGILARSHRYFIAGLFTLLAGVFLVISLLNVRYILWGEDNVLSHYELKQDNVALQETIADLRGENSALRKRIAELRSNPEVIEEVVRRKLNMVREGEILYLEGEQ